ncbi:hypothetical protein [Plantactinospora sp. CA-290183]|uniref:hypothetical protein n=1 Tax=Plantactinospora sp. CA-290183 TaxID=3240006 RepID=UPI003D938363
MTDQEPGPERTIRITVGGAALHTDSADDVVARVLTGLRSAGPGDLRGTLTARRAPTDLPLPRRVPGTHPGSHSPWGDRPTVPAVRVATAIAFNTSSYWRGWRLGHEAARTASLPAVATAVTPLPADRAGLLRRIAVRPGAAAVRLVGVVVHVLPEWERPRYHEEFRAELSRLHGLRQLGYATRLLLSAFALRRALRQTADTIETE